MFVYPTLLHSSLPSWSLPRSGKTSMVQNQAEKSFPPKRQTIKNARNVRQNVSKAVSKKGMLSLKFSWIIVLFMKFKYANIQYKLTV